MDLIVIRHGETDLNKEDRLQGVGEPNLPLNEDGLTAIKYLRDNLLVSPEMIYASPLLRTTQTANIINERFGVPVILSPDLVERDFGTLSGKLRKEIDPKIVENDLEGHYDYHPFGGESIEDVRKRLIHFLSTLPLETKTVALIVTHRGIIRVLYDLFPNHGGGFPITPGSKHVFRVTQKPA